MLHCYVFPANRIPSETLEVCTEQMQLGFDAATGCVPVIEFICDRTALRGRRTGGTAASEGRASEGAAATGGCIHQATLLTSWCENKPHAGIFTNNSSATLRLEQLCPNTASLPQSKSTSTSCPD